MKLYIILILALITIIGILENIEYRSTDIYVVLYTIIYNLLNNFIIEVEVQLGKISRIRISISSRRNSITNASSRTNNIANTP